MHARALTSILLLACLATTARGGTPPDVKCVLAKAKGAGAKAVAKIACHTKAIQKGVPVDPACLAKAEQRFIALFAKAELPGACPTTGDAANVEALVDDFVVAVLAEVGSNTTTTTTTTSTTTTTTLAGCATSYAACTSFVDRTGDLQDRTISFVPNSYSPACMRVRINQTVTFSGAFASHPLRRASCSPPGIPDVSTGTQQAVQLTTPGVHGYYSDLQGTDAGLGMAGAIEVVP